MSFPGMSLAKAENEAGKIVAGIEECCARIEIAGSIRRRKEQVNDIDIVLVWKSKGLGFVTFCRQHGIVPAGGARIIKFKWGPMQIPVQLFMTDEAGWPSELLVRTGSKDHNIMMCTRAREKGLILSVGHGLCYPTDCEDGKRPIAGITTEQDIFKALQMDYIKPEDRR